MGLCLRRLVLQYSWRGGRFQPESMAAFNRNQWQPSTGIGGRFRPESVAIFARNTQSYGYIYVKAYYGTFGIDVHSFFTIQDYLTENIDNIYILILPFILSSFFGFARG